MSTAGIRWLLSFSIFIPCKTYYIKCNRLAIDGPFTSVFLSIFLTSDFFQKRAEGSKVAGGGKGV